MKPLREFLDAKFPGYEEMLSRPSENRRFRSIKLTDVFGRIADQPDLGRLRPDSSRRINLHVFPYYIPYIVRGPTLWILAVAHASREPRYWVSRRNQIG